ncbi:hypothetical protein IB231_04620 [Pantoea sp. PNT02]|uniref:hypothetical protein n=1 Tax=Pantoea sp. PNT02 TaxID=2769261 RepID=UPI001780722D|nr:hypothetical protein [Pantoea sp. PNT02]MBD9642911.1 hypothetical protein [Pantoea sp. PNT02]
MKEIIEAIKKSLADENYQAALFISLSVPDICGQIQDPQIGNGAGARKWFDEYMAFKYCPASLYDSMQVNNPNSIAKKSPEEIQHLKSLPATVTFTSTQYWDLRNAFLHNASVVGKKLTFHLTHSTSHMNVIEDALQLSAKTLCEDICKGLEKWVADMAADPVVSARITQTAEVKNVIAGGKIQFF